MTGVGSVDIGLFLSDEVKCLSVVGHINVFDCVLSKLNDIV